MARKRKRKSPGRSSSKIMRTFPSGGRSIKRSVRKRTATIRQTKKGPRGGTKLYRFPMPDKAHARNALARLPQAKGLTPQQRRRVVRRACAKLYGRGTAKYRACLKRH